MTVRVRGMQQVQVMLSVVPETLHQKIVILELPQVAARMAFVHAVAMPEVHIIHTNPTR
jgi:hypothetical protein